ncbi:MAG: hypothetical protein GY909_15735 [Oligoflexia bacterium]|nr:hypothetical protein [Oligoflexia bacterium]
MIKRIVLMSMLSINLIFASVSFDFSVSDTDLGLGKINPLSKSFREDILLVYTTGVQKSCMSSLLDDSDDEDYSGVIQKRSTSCLIERDSSGEVVINVSGSLEISISNYLGDSGDVILKLNPGHVPSYAEIVFNDFSIEMNASSPNWTGYVTFSAKFLWKDLINSTNVNLSVSELFNVEVFFEPIAYEMRCKEWKKNNKCKKWVKCKLYRDDHNWKPPCGANISSEIDQYLV